jgi:hypothetical protein
VINVHYVQSDCQVSEKIPRLKRFLLLVVGREGVTKRIEYYHFGTIRVMCGGRCSWTWWSWRGVGFLFGRSSFIFLFLIVGCLRVFFFFERRNNIIKKKRYLLYSLYNKSFLSMFSLYFLFSLGLGTYYTPFCGLF